MRFNSRYYSVGDGAAIYITATQPTLCHDAIQSHLRSLIAILTGSCVTMSALVIWLTLRTEIRRENSL